MKQKEQRAGLFRIFLASFCLAWVSTTGAATAPSQLVAAVNKAPVVPDGTTASARGDFVIDFNVDLDPTVAGFALQEGHQIRITLPDAFEFVDPDNFPLSNIRPMTSCVPGGLRCSTAVLLQGWPQNPVPPGMYSLSLEGNTLVYTATADIVPNAPAAPGIKQAHLLLNGFNNPARPGVYELKVRAQFGRGGAWRSGIARVRILPRIQPSINVTSVFADMEDPNPPNPNTIFQRTGPGEAAPYQWDFLLWDATGQPFNDVSIVQVNPKLYALRQGGRLVGRAIVRAPAGAMGQAIVPLGPSFEIPTTPIIGTTFGPTSPTARFTAGFVAGSAAGRYTTIFHLLGGNTIEMIVDVE